MQSQHHLYAAGNPSAAAAAAAYQNAAVAAGYGAPANMNIQPTAAQYNHVVMMPVNHGMTQPAGHAQPAYAGYPGPARDVMYGGQPTGMMLAQPMQQGQRSGTVPQVKTVPHLDTVPWLGGVCCWHGCHQGPN